MSLRLVSVCLLLALALSACVLPAAPVPLAAETAPPTDTGWVEAAPGLERRALTVPIPGQGFAERVIVFRADPARLAARVLYAPGHPRFVTEWAPAARLVFNAGYFDENDVAVALVVSDGQALGRSYAGFGGMLAVGEDGAVRVRSLTAEPYDPAERLMQAAQGFPVLVHADGAVYARAEDAARARRTVVAQDAAGRLVVVIAPHNAFTLTELAAWLRASDLELVTAVNLDGGSSTGYAAGPGDQINSLIPVPAVIALFDRAP